MPTPLALWADQGGIGGFGKKEWQEQAGLSHLGSADRWGKVCLVCILALAAALSDAGDYEKRW